MSKLREVPKLGAILRYRAFPGLGQPRLGQEWGPKMNIDGQGERPRRVRIGRQLITVLVVLVSAGAACSGGGGRHAVATPFGYTLDCPTELIAYGTADLLADAVGSDSPQGAVDTFQGWARPAGDPTIEDQTDDRAVFVFTDEDGNRLGRLVVGKTDNGWFVLQSEECGEGS